jgi:two-component system, OmpR family, response regulator RegX3
LRQLSRRVLCVEDNEDICFMLSSLLRSEGYEPVTASTAGDALALDGRDRFDLFIVDTWLGEVSGVDLCRELRTALPGTPVVFYSAAAFEADQEAALRAGAHAYVTKPGTEELLEAVGRALGHD